MFNYQKRTVNMKLTVSFRLVVALLISIIGLLPTENLHSQTPQVEGSASDIAWSPDGSILAVSGNFGIAFYDEDFQLTQVWNTVSTRKLAWSPDGILLATNTYSRLNDSFITDIWDMQTSQNIATLSTSAEPNGSVFDLIWSPDSQQLAVVTRGGILVFDTGTLHLDFTLPSLRYLEDAAWSPDGRYIAAVEGGVDSPAMLHVWHADTGTSAFTIDLTATAQINDVAALDWNASSTEIALGAPNSGGAVGFLEIASQNISGGYAEAAGGVGLLGWSPDQMQFAAIVTKTYPNRLYMFDGSSHVSGSLWRHFLPDERDTYRNMAWKPDSSQLVILAETYTNDESQPTVRIVDAETGNELAVLVLPDVTPIP